ncbi:uncharacterized protein SPSK_08127 [Sporothrix schenckii 1099-18]|uniref:Uncharacterized protein n=1 Tax=Sporothrix schenckii 1099-18 TaxID=1397361 RepID=A0A0F2MDD0_SPOSC|nr:uncharacterized protein SPSK_08127 [Sporothrix schenckii 1099-18]KJR87693.1 hypothetical protein SPSK_08127 [Sporothrix schenckii 1099-18]
MRDVGVNGTHGRSDLMALVATAQKGALLPPELPISHSLPDLPSKCGSRLSWWKVLAGEAGQYECPDGLRRPISQATSALCNIWFWAFFVGFTYDSYSVIVMLRKVWGIRIPAGKKTGFVSMLRQA